MSTLSLNLNRHPVLNGYIQRIWALIGGVSIRTKILGIVLLLTTTLGLSITFQVRAVMTRTLIGELEDRGISVTSDLAVRSIDPILLNDTFALYELLTETRRNHSDVEYVFVVDPEGQVLAHTFENGFPTALLNTNAPTDDGMIHEFQYRSNNDIIHDFAAPIFAGRSGTVRVGMSETRLRNAINLVTSQMLLTTVIAGLAGILAATVLTLLLTRPILALVNTTNEVRQGDLSVRAPHWADDEIGTLADAFNQMVKDLEISRQVVIEKENARTQLLSQLIEAQEEERRRIARDLHDSVGQSLTSLMIGLKLLGQLTDPAEAQNKRQEMRQIAAETLEGVRSLSHQLRPSILDDLGLTSALKRYASEFVAHYPHLSVDVHSNLAQRLPRTIETSLYRIVQEAMTNAARHNSVVTISVLLSKRNGHVQAIIEDNGEGFDPEQVRRTRNSVGLQSMQERAELLGGTLSIESSDKGTTVFVEVPL